MSEEGPRYDLSGRSIFIEQSLKIQEPLIPRRPHGPSPVAERKDQIITAALELFLRNGLASVSTRDLAEHTGLSRSHLYHYFSDWKTLRRAAFERFSEEQLAGTQALLQGSTPSLRSSR